MPKCSACSRDLPQSEFARRQKERKSGNDFRKALVCKNCIAEQFAKPSSGSSAAAPPERRSRAASDFVDRGGYAAQPEPSDASPTAASSSTAATGSCTFATKKQLRASAGGAEGGRGNLIFVDMFYWLKGVVDDWQDADGAPLDGFLAHVEDLDAPQICRAALWGMPCQGCRLAHPSGTLKLWSRRRTGVAKAPPWMRSPPSLPALRPLHLGALEERLNADPEECRLTLAPRVQFVTFRDRVVWGRDLGEDSRAAFDAFLAAVKAAGTGSMPEPPSEHVVEAAAGPRAELSVDVLRGALQFLEVRQLAGAVLALLSSEPCRSSDLAELALLLPERARASLPAERLSPRGFLRAARGACLAQRLLAATAIARADPGGVRAAAYADPDPPRCFLPQGAVCSMALSQGLCAFAVEERHVKFVRRYDLKQCGFLHLRKGGGVQNMALSVDGQVLGVVKPMRPAEVHFYNVSEGAAEAARAVAVLPLSEEEVVCGLDFLPGGTPAEAVAACGATLLHLSAAPAEVVARWPTAAEPSAPGAQVGACQAAGPNHAVTLSADGAVQLWDVRVATGAVARARLEHRPSALAAGPSAPGDGAYTAVGDQMGGVHIVDWRAGGCQLVCDLGAPPANTWNEPMAAAVRRLAWGAGSTLLAVNSASLSVLQGSGPGATWQRLATTRLRPDELGPVAVGPGAWAIALGSASAKRELWIIDYPGEGRRARDSCVAGKLKKRQQRPDGAPYRRKEERGRHARSSRPQ